MCIYLSEKYGKSIPLKSKYVNVGKVCKTGIAFCPIIGYNNEKSIFWEFSTLKKLIVLLGPNAVGKSSVCKSLLEQCPNSAYVDADWCRQINPFPFTNATKKTVTDNLYSLIRNYLLCEDIQWVFFPYGLHGERDGIFRELIARLDAEHLEVQVHTIVLKCSMEEIIRRGKADGRDRERIERGILHTFSLYEDLELPSIDTTELPVEEAAAQVLKLVGEEPVPIPKKKRDLRPLLALLLIPVILMGFLLGRCSVPDPVIESTLSTIESTSVSTPETTEVPASEEPTVPTSLPTEPATETTQETEAPTEEATEASTAESTEETSAIMDYVINKNSLKFHYPDCESVGKMKESNKEFFTGTREELLERGCDPCGNCNP